MPTRVREELAGAGVDVVVVCSRPDCSAALAATAAGMRLVIGNAGEADVWERAGLHAARAVGLLGADDLQNLSAALLVAEETPDTPVVVRMFSAELAGGISRVLGERATVMSETEVAAPAFLQAALSGNTGQRVTIAGQVLEVAEVDAEDPRLVVALCNASTPTDVLPPRAALDRVVLGLIDPDGLVLGARGAFPPTVALHRQQRERRRAASRPRHSRRQRVVAALRLIPGRALRCWRRSWSSGRRAPPSSWSATTCRCSMPCTSRRRRWRPSATATSTCSARRTGSRSMTSG